MHTDPLLSVITPAYRCAQFLPECIKSVQAQTYTNWEMIIVDDGSDDGLIDVAKSFAREDPRIKPHRLEVNGGTAVAYNEAVRQATGEILVHQEADDWCDPTRFEKQLQELNVCDADLCSCLMNRHVFHSSKNPKLAARIGYRLHKIIRGRDVKGTGCIPTRYCQRRSPKGPITGSLMVRRRVHEVVGPYITELHGRMTFAADSEWIFRVLLEDPPFVWAHVHEELYDYRDYAGQISKRQIGRQTVKDHLYFQRKYAPAILKRLAGKEKACKAPS